MKLGSWQRKLSGGLLIVGALLVAVAIGSELYDRWQTERDVRLATQTLAAINSPATRPRPTLLIPSATPAPASTLAKQAAPETLPQSALPETPKSSAVSPTPGSYPSPLPPTTVPDVALVAVQSGSGASAPPSRLVIPFLQIDVAVEQMGWRAVETTNGVQSQWVIPQDAAGYHLNSAQIGEGGNVVISGHNNIYGRVFEPISLFFDPKHPDAYIGNDVLITTDDGRVVTYRIERVHFLQEAGVSLEQRMANAQVMAPTEEETLTIVTCWPMTSNTHRIVLQARPISL